MENGIPQKIHAQIGIPIKIVDKTSTPKKIAKFKILNKKIGRAYLNNLCITNIIQIIQIIGKVIHYLAKIMI